MVTKIHPGVGPQFPQVVVLVGATGDLARRKLLPGMFYLWSSGFIPGCRIIGTSLDDLSADDFRKIARGALAEFSTRKVDEAAWADFANSLQYVPMARGADALKAAVIEAERAFNGESRRLHYLSVPPNAALSAVRLLGEAGLVERSRIIMEKPFGTDLASAVTLNARLHEVFDEDQIFRIDHFLGKEAAQNILAFRFANGLFEPIWNRNFIDHVQIDVPETLGLGKRSGFYEQTGAYRDMVVTHLFQILGFMAMEAPTSLEPNPISHPRTVHGIPVGRGGVRRFGYGDLHCAQMLHRQLALGRHTVLPAHGQAACPGAADHFDRVSRAAEEHVPCRIRRQRARAGSPDIRFGGCCKNVAVVLRQAPRPRHAAG